MFLFYIFVLIFENNLTCIYKVKMLAEEKKDYNYMKTYIYQKVKFLINATTS